MFITDDSAITRKGFCTISWNLKADVLDGYIIFVTGDPVTLGCWEPDMAVQLDASIKSKNEWTAEIKVTPLLKEITVSASQVIWCSLGHFPKLVYHLSKVTLNSRSECGVPEEILLNNKACLCMDLYGTFCSNLMFLVETYYCFAEIFRSAF